MTKDEEANIAKCLRALRRFEQVFVVDSGSKDRTQEIARSFGAEVIDFVWDGAYPKKKQWCLDNLPFRHEWALYVDADEIVTAELEAEIARVVGDCSKPTMAGYFVRYDYVFLGQRLRHGHQVSKLVLLDRTKSCFPAVDDLAAENMWEVEGHYQPRVDGKVGSLDSVMVHDDHDSLYHYFDRHNRYSDWEAVTRENASTFNESQRGLRPLAKSAFGRMPFKGLVAFLHSYLVRSGFRDGRAGFHYAVARGYYYWQTELKMQERRRRSGAWSDVA
jgi:glycosyltransferase involved in cell wall biosynthesis